MIEGARIPVELIVPKLSEGATDPVSGDPARIDVVFAANRSYVPYLSAALTSLRHNLAPRATVHARVLTRDLAPADLRWPNRRQDDTLDCVAPPIPADTRLPIRNTDHVSLETYYRLFLDLVFDASVKRVIYLDSDLVVLGDLARLQALDLKGKTVAAAWDLHVRDWSQVRCLDSPHASRQTYFNAGVLVIDLEAWRARSVGSRAVRFLAETPHEVLYWDQDALNHALRDDWQPLDPRWNRMSCYWEQSRSASLPFPPNVVAQLADPYIVHFASQCKPWHAYRHPDRAIFDRYVTMAGFPEQRMTFTKALRRKVGRYLTRT